MYLLFVQILGDAICELTYQIIEEWTYLLSKVQYIITDNGSNMVKAFKSVQAFADRQKRQEGDKEVDDYEEEDGNILEEVGRGEQEGRGGSVFLYLFLYYQYMGCQCVNWLTIKAVANIIQGKGESMHLAEIF